MRVGNGNYQKVFPLFGKGTAITKKLSRSSVQEQQTPKSLMALWEWEFKTFPLGNIQEHEFLLMPEYILY